MGKLDGKVAIVTGAAGGIGKAIALLFAAEGAKVVGADRILNEGDNPTLPEVSLNTTVSEIEKAGGTAAAVQCDVSREESCDDLVAKTKEVFGPADVLVNNAAVNMYVPIKDYPVRRWMSYFAVNVHGPFMLSQKVLLDMIERGSGAIVNITSRAAIGPGRGPYTSSGGGGTMYGVSKAAVERFSQGLAQEVYQYGISVTALAPSLDVSTPGTRLFRAQRSTAGVITTPTAGLGDEPPEMMARAALLLATEPLDKVTGRVTYSQAILKEFGWIAEGKSYGIDQPGSGFSQI